MRICFARFPPNELATYQNAQAAINLQESADVLPKMPTPMPGSSFENIVELFKATWRPEAKYVEWHFSVDTIEIVHRTRSSRLYALGTIDSPAFVLAVRLLGRSNAVSHSY